jgi:hypothetical protein
VAVLFAEVGDVGAGGLEDPQAEQPEHGHEGGLPRRRERLPQQFDPVTNRTIELIDVLWLDGNAIVAAFEIESTTSIYSELLRMSDLLARQPNISVPLSLVTSRSAGPRSCG